MGRVPRIPCPDAGSSHQTGCRAHPSARRLGRDRVRCELRRPGRLPRARRLRRARAHARPLRGRRAPDAARARRRPSGCTPWGSRTRCARRSATSSSTRRSKTFRWTLPWTFSTFDYPELCALLRAQAPDVEFDTAKVDGRTGFTLHTDRGDLTAPLIVDGARAGGGCSPTRRRPSSRPTRGSRAGWRSTRHASGDDLELWLDPAYVRAGYSWSFPARERAARGRGLLRAARPRQGADGAPGRRPRRPGRALPGQLDPPPDARARRGRHLLRRRQRRALPAHDGRGHPHRAVLRPRLRARAAARRRRPPDARAGARRAMPSSARSTAGRSPGCCACSAGSAG